MGTLPEFTARVKGNSLFPFLAGGWKVSGPCCIALAMREEDGTGKALGKKRKKTLRTEIDCESNHPLTVAFEFFEDVGMERGRARTGIDLGGQSFQPKFGQLDLLAPADGSQRLLPLGGKRLFGPVLFSHRSGDTSRSRRLPAPSENWAWPPSLHAGRKFGQGADQGQ